MIGHVLNYHSDNSDQSSIFVAQIMFDKYFVRDSRLIGHINPNMAFRLFFYELMHKKNVEMAKYVLENLNPTQEKVTGVFERWLVGYNAENDILRKTVIQELLSTNKIELDGIDRSQFSLEIQNMLNSYERARERGRGASSRKYTRMGELIVPN